MVVEGMEVLQLQQILAQDSPLRSANVKLLAVAQRDDVGSARHRADAAHHFDVGQRAATEPDEMRRAETGLQVLVDKRSCVSFRAVVR